MSTRYPNDDGPDPLDPRFYGPDGPPSQNAEEDEEERWFNSFDLTTWDTLELAVHEVREAMEHDRAAASLLHRALASRIRAQIQALTKRLEAITDPFARSNLQRFVRDLSMRAHRHERAMKNLQRDSAGPKPSVGWYFFFED